MPARVFLSAGPVGALGSRSDLCVQPTHTCAPPGAQYRHLTDFVSNDAGAIAFVAQLSSAVVSTGELNIDHGVWLHRGHKDSVPELLLRHGDRFDLEPGDQRSILLVRIASQSNPHGGVGGYGRQLNDSGKLLLRLSLTGNSSGVFMIDAPLQART